ncbi:hypothetical protein [Microcella alkalica]|uniref:hypothetical protein n=1 Tax=Microcella alkalica TaxID=355930 RepID=UPI00145F85EB|nr:hypothetical protein [Microcella alkalica]
MTASEYPCSHCHEWKPADAFGFDRSRVTGLAYRCKACERERFRAMRQDPVKAERRRAQNRESYRRAVERFGHTPRSPGYPGNALN